MSSTHAQDAQGFSPLPTHPPTTAPHHGALPPYRHIALEWARLGFACVPAREDKSPAVGFKAWSAGRDHAPSRRITTAQALEWAHANPRCDRALLLLDSNPACRLVAVDVDDPSLWPWVRETYGATPLVVYSGRDVPEGA